MTGNILGEQFVLVSFGESHGNSVGAVIDGCPAGLQLEKSDIQKELDLRRPGSSSISTPRNEADKVQILSGIYNGYTTGAPICLITDNTNTDSKSYEIIKNSPRPGHADLVAKMKYGNFNDYRGSGRFSARRTVSYVMGGAIAKKLLFQTLKTRIVAYTVEIGNIKSKSISFNEAEKHRYDNDVRCPDFKAAEKMQSKILSVKKAGDSVGGIIECVVKNIPIGLGAPCFSALDSDIAKAMLSIPAVKGIEFGSGFEGAKRLGSENNDQYTIKDNKIISKTNNAGGIIGGISNGMPLIIRLAFKPVASISKPQSTVNMKTMKEEKIEVTGRHDPCVVPRAIPIVESIMALVLTDHALKAQLISPLLKK